ncbi:autotransporter domain-containing protein [Candidatus Pelagibacter sp.]|nr:autotransporter domain-containing protein [Candidatus Pelagibacter sp.]
MKLLKFISLLFIFFLTSFKAFGAVSGFVDNKDIAQRIAHGIAFNANGTKMFISGSSQNKVLEFDLTVGFDVSTATKNSNECTHSDEDEDVIGLKLSSDGTKMFLIGSDSGAEGIEEYKLDTAYDVSSCDFVTTHFEGEMNIRDIAFNNSGTKLFIYDGTGNDFIKKYSLTGPFNISNATFEQQSTGTSSKTFSQLEGNPQGLAFSSDGSKMYITGHGKDKVQEFNLSTPFDLSNVTKKGGYDVSDDGVEQVSGIAFSSDGLKMFVLDFKTGNKTVSEYNLTCGFGVINCIDPTANKDDVASAESQSEAAKKLIQHTTYPVLNRMEWLRRNSNRLNLTNQNIKFQFNNEILNSLTEELIPLYFSNNNSSDLNQNSSWSFWSEGTISIGKIGDTSNSSSKDINTSAITFGADKRSEDNIMRGIALRFGSDDVDVGDLGSALDMSSFSLTFYESKPKGGERFTDHLLGLSFINSDLLNNSGSTSTDGERYGEQLYGSLSLRDTFSKNKLNFTPKIKINYGITHFGEYTETGAAGLNLKFEDQYIGNFTSSIGASLDNTYELKIGSLIPYFDFEYYADMSPSSQQKFSYESDGSAYTFKNINNATHNIIGGIGFDLISNNGLTLMTKYTRDQAKDSKNDNFVIALDYKNSQRSLYSMTFQDSLAKLSHNKELDNFQINLDSHYELFDKDPDYGLFIKLLSVN